MSLINSMERIEKIFDKIVLSIKGMFDFLIAEVLKIIDFIASKANELSVLINVLLIYQHPPQNDIQYITFCVYLAINTVVLLKKGNVNIEKIAKDLERAMTKK